MILAHVRWLASAYRDNLDEVKAFAKWCKGKGFTTEAI